MNTTCTVTAKLDILASEPLGYISAHLQHRKEVALNALDNRIKQYAIEEDDYRSSGNEPEQVMMQAS